MNAIGERRRFQLIDALLLTAAVAIGLAVIGMLDSTFPLPQDADAILWWFRIAISVQILMLTSTWILTLLILADFRVNRTSLMSPGKLALVCISVASMTVIPFSWGDLVVDHASMWFRICFLPFSILTFPAVPGCVAISAEVTLRLVGVNRVRSDWLDLAGYSLTGAWILNALSTPLRDLSVREAIGLVST